MYSKDKGSLKKNQITINEVEYSNINASGGHF